MSDASGTYASPTGSELRSEGAGQKQGIDEGYENVSFQLDAGEQNSGQASMRRASIGTMATQLGGAGTLRMAPKASIRIHSGHSAHCFAPAQLGAQERRAICSEHMPWSNLQPAPANRAFGRNGIR